MIGWCRWIESRAIRAVSSSVVTGLTEIEIVERGAVFVERHA